MLYFLAKRNEQILVVSLAAFALRSYASGRAAIRGAIQSTRELLLSSGDAAPAADVGGAGRGHGWGGIAAADMASAAGAAVPLLHPQQVGLIVRPNRV